MGLRSRLFSSATHARRKLSTAAQPKRQRRRMAEDEGDWRYSSEWWGTESLDHGNVIFRGTSDKGNGVVSVLAYPSSKPSAVYWPETERWLNQRFLEVNPKRKETVNDDELRVVGYHWRVLRFNDHTRQSTVKVMAARKVSEPGSLILAQQPHCLATPYLKSMVSAGLSSLASCNYDLSSAVLGHRPMRVLCIGHGGGSLPLFLANSIQGALVDIVEIDPLVISASIQAMGFPSISVATQPSQSYSSKPDMMSEVLWRGIHDRIFLYESDAEHFMLNTTGDLYDLIFVDAYDGDDIFPRKLWDSDYPFLKALSNRLHPEHGTTVVNLHSDAEITSSSGSVSSLIDPILPMGRYISGVCKAYKDMLVEKRSSCSGKHDLGIGFVVSSPWVCNTTLVVCRGFRTNGKFVDRDSVLNTLMLISPEVDDALNLPFSSSEYVKRGFLLLD